MAGGGALGVEEKGGQELAVRTDFPPLGVWAAPHVLREVPGCPPAGARTRVPLAPAVPAQVTQLSLHLQPASPLETRTEYRA